VWLLRVAIGAGQPVSAIEGLRSSPRPAYVSRGEMAVLAGEVPAGWDRWVSESKDGLADSEERSPRLVPSPPPAVAWHRRHDARVGRWTVRAASRTLIDIFASSG